MLKSLMQREESGLWRCISCDYSSMKITNVKDHIEAKHLSLSYPCSYCSMTCPTKVALRMHMKRKHY